MGEKFNNISVKEYVVETVRKLHCWLPSMKKGEIVGIIVIDVKGSFKV